MLSYALNNYRRNSLVLVNNRQSNRPNLVLQVKRRGGIITDFKQHFEAGPLCILHLWQWDPRHWRPRTVISYKSIFPDSSSYLNLMGKSGKAAEGLGQLPIWGFKKLWSYKAVRYSVKACYLVQKCCLNSLLVARRCAELGGGNLQQLIPMLSSDPKLLRSSL